MKKNYVGSHFISFVSGQWWSPCENSFSKAECDRDQHLRLQGGARSRRVLFGLTLSRPAEVHSLQVQAAGRHLPVCFGLTLPSPGQGACWKPGQTNRCITEEGTFFCQKKIYKVFISKKTKLCLFKQFNPHFLPLAWIKLQWIERHPFRTVLRYHRWRHGGVGQRMSKTAEALLAREQNGQLSSFYFFFLHLSCWNSSPWFQISSLLFCHVLSLPEHTVVWSDDLVKRKRIQWSLVHHRSCILKITFDKWNLQSCHLYFLQ